MHPATYKPLGRWIDSDFVLDDLEVVVWIDCTEVSRFAVAGMVHSLADYLVAITRYITLVPAMSYTSAPTGLPFLLSRRATWLR